MTQHISWVLLHRNKLFSLLNQTDLTNLVTKIKSTTCALDPIPTKLLKEVFSTMDSTVLNIINSSLSSGVVPDFI